jgi:PhzF family phenazine biosynthesis protein
MSKKLQIYQVDAFTNEPFKGNPAGVCLLDKNIDEQTMQLIAREMNLSETAFIIPSEDDKAGCYQLRWFTPEVEIPLCGHATLAASKILFDMIHIPVETITYRTKSGKLTCKKESNGFILDFPIDYYENSNAPGDLIRSLGVKKLVNTVYGKNTKKLILHIESEEELNVLKPDFEQMKNLTFESKINGVAVTAKGQGRIDFVSRYFNPWAGVNEDPVTGSVHTVLASYWGDLLKKKELTAHQKSRRGGEIEIKILENDRVELKGDAVIVLEGTLFI